MSLWPWLQQINLTWARDPLEKEKKKTWSAINFKKQDLDEL